MKKVTSILIFAGFICSSVAWAKWAEPLVIKDETVTARVKITQNLSYVPDLVNFLNQIQFPAPSKLVVEELAVKVVEYKWINDSTCSLPKGFWARIAEGSATYYFADDPETHESVSTSNGLPGDPCQFQATAAATSIKTKILD